MARDILRRNGFVVRRTSYSDTLAFPLSGGYIARPMLPRWAARPVMAFDAVVARVFGRALAWRYLLSAEAE
jgi:hypothetical protein